MVIDQFERITGMDLPDISELQEDQHGRFMVAAIKEAQAAAGDFSEVAVKQALAFMEPVWTHLRQDGIGSLSELKDGNYPHTARGCYAHAATVAEVLRVYMRLKYQYGGR